MALLIKHGLMPEEEGPRRRLEQIDPYVIRKKALSEAVDLHEFGRALFHLNQRRGFKSNRKTEDPKEEGKIATGAAELSERLQKSGHETLGSFYADRQANPEVRKRKAVRIRLEGEGADARYEFYPLRQMLEHEFDLLWSRQKEFHPNFPDDDVRDEIRHAIFHQRR